ncbi:MAG: N-acetylmuramoyl-L-alanine amidase family protein [Candidatus Avilachnospira sp.]|jgi:glucan-binding YG repeat protein
MRKKGKITAALSAGALMALFAGGMGDTAVLSDIFAGMDSYAAQGWQLTDGEWYYYGSNDALVTNELKKSDDNWYYLGSDGRMVRNYMYEDDEENIYYFNSDGAMVKNSWILYDDGSGESNWYYFDSAGKAARKKSDSDNIYTRSIDGKTYGFDEDGKMLYGWTEEDGELITDEDDPFMEARYYFGDFDDGVMRKNTWLQYEEGSEEDSNVDGISYEDKDVLWFFFDSSGKKTIPSSNKETVEKTINGSKYIFDKNGVMLSSWIDTNTSTSPTASPSYKYFSDDIDGHLMKDTWVYAVPDEDMDPEDYNDDEYSWFYVDKSGKSETNGIAKVKGKKYAFDNIGRMQTEFVLLKDGSFSDNLTVDEDDLEAEDFKNSSSEHFDELSDGDLYYFDADEEKGGQMKTGKSIKIDLSDDTYTFGFNKDGKAYGSGGVLEEVSRKYYINGLLLAADKEMKYGLVELSDGSFAVVNSGGTLQKGDEKALKDGDGGYILINEDRYYGYTDDDDHKPVWVDGAAFEYDRDAENDEHAGDEISYDADASEIPDDMVIYRADR